MTLPIIWREEAETDLLDILDYIAARNKPASQRLRAVIYEAVDCLPDHPHIHRPGRIPGTREAIVHPNYILISRVAEAIEILAVLHSRQQYP